MRAKRPVATPIPIRHGSAILRECLGRRTRIWPMQRSIASRAEMARAVSQAVVFPMKPPRTAAEGQFLRDRTSRRATSWRARGSQWEPSEKKWGQGYGDTLEFKQDGAQILV